MNLVSQFLFKKLIVFTTNALCKDTGTHEFGIPISIQETDRVYNKCIVRDLVQGYWNT